MKFTTNFAAVRAKLIKQLRTEIRDEKVLEVMSSIPRELFIPNQLLRKAYDDTPLPIGFGQTISQPFIVALMTEALRLVGGEKVLEIGTGSGYQSAILSRLAREVITVERVPELAETARKNLSHLMLTNIVVHLAEETLGWHYDAPYDAIIVTAAAPQVPADLMAQLAIGGRMVIPIGPGDNQKLCCITRGRDKNKIAYLCACRFVPLIGKGA